MVIMIYYSVRGSPRGSMTHLMVENCVGKYHYMFFGIFEKTPTICVESTFSIFNYVSWIFIFTFSCFRALKSPMVIINGTLVYSVGGFIQTFIEIFPNDWVLLRDYQGRSVSNN